jgi:RND family efflux transporter MFP subunit
MKRSLVFSGLKIAVILLITAAALAALFQVTSRDGSDGRKSGRSQSIVGVNVAPVERRELVEQRVFSGTLEAEKQYDAAAKIGGRIQEIGVSLGQCVKRGDLIAELDSEEFEQQLAQAQAELEVARASLTQARTNLIAAERNYQRAIKLREQKVSAEAELEEAETEKLTKQAGVNLALAQIKQREAALRAAEVRLSYTTLTADWQGGDPDDCRYVARTYVDAGDTISANAPLATLVDLSLLKAVINVAERDYGFLEIGQPADISVDIVPGRTFPGTVERLAPVFNETSRQARVEISVANPDTILKGGMFARVHIELGRAEQTIAAPSSAVVQRLGKSGVFIVEDGTARFFEVTPGIEDGGWTQVTGLQEGQLVVTLGHHLLSDGVRVSYAVDGQEPRGKPQP